MHDKSLGMNPTWLALQFPHLALDLLTRGNGRPRDLPLAVFFGFKDRLSDLLCSRVVYEFTCPNCQIRYSKQLKRMVSNSHKK